MSDASPARPRTVAIIQARMSSSRLPGKVLMPIAGRPAILFMCERVRRARSIDALCVATSVDPSDDPLAACVAEAGIAVHRGSLDDVFHGPHGSTAPPSIPCPAISIGSRPR